MDDERRNFDATLAFLAEFPDGAIADSAAQVHSVPYRAESHALGRLLHAVTADAAMSDSTLSISRETLPRIPTSAGARNESSRKPHVRASSTNNAKATSRSKQPKRSETEDVRETKKGSSVAETVTTVKPLSRKDEIEFLREQVVDLERELEQMKRPSQGKGQRVDGGHAGGGSAGRGTLTQTKRIPSMWEDLATRQYEQRQSAQVENLKLKTMLEDQLKVAASLQRMLKRSKTEEIQISRPAKKPG